MGLFNKKKVKEQEAKVVVEQTISTDFMKGNVIVRKYQNNQGKTIYSIRNYSSYSSSVSELSKEDVLVLVELLAQATAVTNEE